MQLMNKPVNAVHFFFMVCVAKTNETHIEEMGKGGGLDAGDHIFIRILNQI